LKMEIGCRFFLWNLCLRNFSSSVADLTLGKDYSPLYL
jgi:hypothetical protein